MPLYLKDKKAIVAEISQLAMHSLSLVAADHQRVTVSEMTQLRTKARQVGVCLKVVRNTLAKRALSDTQFACMEEVLSGPLILAFAKQEPCGAARLIQDFIKDHGKLEVRALSIDGKLLDATALEAVAKLPTRLEAISMLMSVLKAPSAKLARTLSSVPEKLLRVMVALKDQKTK